MNHQSLSLQCREYQQNVHEEYVAIQKICDNLVSAFERIFMRHLPLKRRVLLCRDLLAVIFVWSAQKYCEPWIFWHFTWKCKHLDDSLIGCGEYFVNFTLILSRNIQRNIEVHKSVGEIFNEILRFTVFAPTSHEYFDELFGELFASEIFANFPVVTRALI